MIERARGGRSYYACMCRPARTQKEEAGKEKEKEKRENDGDRRIAWHVSGGGKKGATESTVVVA